MAEIRNTVKGIVLKLVKNVNTTYVYVTDLMNKIWDDYIRAAIDNVYTRGLLRDLQFTDTQIFHMLEQLQVGRREFEENDYQEVSYQ
jgi:hypothetical protein